MNSLLIHHTMTRSLTQDHYKFVSTPIVMGVLTKSNEELKSLLREMQAQNEARLVQVKARMEARIPQFETCRQNMCWQLQNFLSNPKNNCNKDSDASIGSYSSIQNKDTRIEDRIDTRTETRKMATMNIPRQFELQKQLGSSGWKTIFWFTT